MPTILIAAIVAATTTVAAPPPAVTPEPALRCSKIVFEPSREEHEVVLVGAALAETIVAGAGDVEFAVSPGEDRDAVGRAVRGQLVDVAAIDRHTRALLPAGTERVLLVPWAYGADCTTYPWDHLQRWVEPGARGLFLGGLRERARWAGGVPTIDVHAPYQLPYTGRPRSARDTTTALTPAELLSLYDALPGPGADPEARRVAARAWARAHPELARRRPAATILARLREPGEAPRYKGATSPILGTWRLAASLDGGPARTGWLRTWDRTSHADVRQPTPAARAADPFAPPRVLGYYAIVAGDTALAALPDTAPPRMPPSSGYVHIAVTDERAPLDAGPWRGSFAPGVLAHAFASDPAIAAFLRVAETAQVVAYQPDGTREPTATFTRDADGALRVEARIALADGRTLLIRGVRVSDVVIRDGPPAR